MKITNEDNMELMARYPDNHFDLAIVDPPYGIGKDWTKDKMNVMKTHTSSYKNDSIPSREYFEQLMRVSKNQIIWGGNYYTDFLPAVNHWIVWDKKVDYPTQHHSEGELAWHSFNVPLRIFEGIWNGACKCEKVKKQHPHQKPVKLYEWLLMNYAKEGNKILDTHLGSGSIAIACHNLGFDLTACELDKEYYDSAMKRIELHKQQIRMF